MKQWVNNIIYSAFLRIQLIRLSILYGLQISLAYQANIIIKMIGAGLWMATTIVFIDILYVNVETIAGYTRDDMLFFTLIGQIAYGINVSASILNLEELIRRVNDGGLDLVLSKPLPQLFYVSFRNIDIFHLIDLLPNITLLGILINWSNLHLSVLSLIIGFIIILLGVYCVHIFQFIFTIPSFWLGESNNLLAMTWAVEFNFGRFIPFEGLSDTLKTVFSTLIPVLFSTAISTSVILGKSEPWQMLAAVIAVTGCMILIKVFAWRIALRNYTSASS